MPGQISGGGEESRYGQVSPGPVRGGRLISRLDIHVGIGLVGGLGGRRSDGVRGLGG